MAYKINSHDQWFLNMRRRDPLQGREFEIGDKVVICTKCRSVQTYDSWEFNGNKCLLCEHTGCTDDFSREYIDLSYHREDKGLKNIRGFKVVESDVKYRTDKIRKWFSQQRIKHTYKERLWFHIILLILVGGAVGYYGWDSAEYYVSANIVPLLNNSAEKLSRMISEAPIDIFTKFNTLDWKINKFPEKIAFIQGRFIMLGTGLLYMGKNIMDSLAQLDLEGKGTTIITNIREFIEYISQLIKR